MALLLVLGRRSSSQRLPIFSISILAIFALAGTLGPFLAPYPPNQTNFNESLQPPVFSGGTWQHVLGTDALGRDILSRLIAGARVSLLVALAVVVGAGLIGFTVALVAGSIGGWVDALLSRTADTALVFPFVLLAIVIAAIFGAGIRNLIFVLIVALWPQYARTLRGEVLKIKTQDFVATSRTMGSGQFWILRHHLVPNLLPTFFVIATLQVGQAIIAEGALSFLGIGVPPPAASWGNMIASSTGDFQTAWWTAVLPVAALSLTVLAANLMGNWLRVRSDPTAAG